MKVLALIPARAGSKRLPNKNLSLLCGKTLVRWAIDSVTLCDACAVSTDYSDVLLRPLSRADYIPRPEELCRDDTQSIDVVQHALDWYQPRQFDAVLLLQPTSPLRTKEDVAASIRKLEETKADAVVSVTDAETWAMFELGHADRLRPVIATPSATRLVIPNGAIFLLTTEAISRGQDWWTCDVAYAYVMPRERSIDIDTEADLEMARAAMMRREVAL